MKQLFLALLVFGNLTADAQLPVMVQDILTGAASSYPYAPVLFNSKLYLSADTGGSYRYLYSYDGNSPVKNVPSPIQFQIASPAFYTVWNSKLYLSSALTGGGKLCPALYVHDGTNPITPAPGIAQDTFIGGFSAGIVSGSRLYLIGTKTVTKNDLWYYDGLGPITMVNVSPSITQGSRANNLIEYNGKLYFNANTTANGVFKMYALIPANNSFNVVTDANYPSGVEIVGGAITAKGKLYFVGKGDTAGNELYSYDGTSITRLSNIAVGGNTKNGVRPPLCQYGEDIYFQGSTDGVNYQLYRCGTSSPSVSLAAVVNSTGNADIRKMAVYKNKLYFSASTSAQGRELWRYDAQGANIVADLNPGTANGIVNNNNDMLIVYNSQLYFSGSDGTRGYELFRLNDPTGIVEKAGWAGSVSAYPNPASSELNLSIIVPSAQKIGVSLTDVSGRQLYAKQLSGYDAGKHVINIPVQGLAQGQYFYRLYNDYGQTLTSGSVDRL